jgi:hypothetical protein
MKITMMVVLILTIAAISHLAMAARPAHRDASEQLSHQTEHPPALLLTSSRNMWVSILIALIIATACLGIAIFVMQPAELI